MTSQRAGRPGGHSLVVVIACGVRHSTARY